MHCQSCSAAWKNAVNQNLRGCCFTHGEQRCNRYMFPQSRNAITTHSSRALLYCQSFALSSSSPSRFPTAGSVGCNLRLFNFNITHSPLHMNPANGKLRKPAPAGTRARLASGSVPAGQHQPRSLHHIPSMNWLFRSNIPRKRSSYLATDIKKRNYFGISEIMSVIANPAETVRSLTESKRLLEEARRELQESRERSQLRPRHTFARLPGFFPRKAEMQAIERALEGEPSFTIVFGASSVGKTALLREVLSRDNYHVLHFDLRIAGFADLSSLYTSLSQQMEQYFEEIAKLEGYEEFVREAWGFKHDRLNVDRRMSESADAKQQTVKTSDVARLMELFQSSLLKYWEFQPVPHYHKEYSSGANKPRKQGRRQDSDDSGRTRTDETVSVKSKRWGLWGRRKNVHREELGERSSEETRVGNEKVIEKERPVKKMPVIFFDEAHKLPALIQSADTMKCLLDSMLVLTKQDRLCHVIHATSDPFYQTWLRQFNVMQHCKIITISDCSKAETRKFYRERVIPRVPERIRGPLNFEVLYDAFGGKLAHWHDYITDYVNSNGTLDIKQSSHFLQAHSLLNLQIIHSSQSTTTGPAGQDSSAAAANTSVGNGNANTTGETLHPSLGPAGFKLYSPLAYAFTAPGSLGTPTAVNIGETASFAGSTSMGLSGPPEFSAMQLLKVMSRLSKIDTPYLAYFYLCRELGVRAVDGMVKSKVLDLRWTESVCATGFVDAGGAAAEVAASSSVAGGSGIDHSRDNTLVNQQSGVSSTSASSSTTLANSDIPLPPPPPPPIDGPHEDVMMPVSETEMGRFRRGVHSHSMVTDVFYDDMMEVVGPKLFPITPIMRFAMRDVVHEYEDNQSVSEYASLSDVDEY